MRAPFKPWVKRVRAPKARDTCKKMGKNAVCENVRNAFNFKKRRASRGLWRASKRRDTGVKKKGAIQARKRSTTPRSFHSFLRRTTSSTNGIVACWPEQQNPSLIYFFSKFKRMANRAKVYLEQQQDPPITSLKGVCSGRGHPLWLGSIPVSRRRSVAR